MVRPRWTRRDLLRLGAISVGAVALGACAPQERVVEKVVEKPVEKIVEKVVTATAAPAAKQIRRVHFLRWSSFVPGEDKWHTEYLRDNWAKPNNVELVVESVAGNDLQPKVSVALETGTGPDIVQLNHNWAHLYAPKLLDVGAITSKQDKDGGGFYDVFKALNNVNGIWKAVPFVMQAPLIVYRTDWLKEVGEAKFPETFEELRRVGKVMKEKKKIPYGQAWGHSFSDPGTMAYPLTWAFGGKEVEADGRTVAINSKETVAAVEFAVQWFKDAMSPEMLGWDDSSNNRAYLGEQLWATLNGASIYVVAKKDFPKIAEVSDHALLPKGPAGRFHLGFPYSYAIPAYVKDPAPAKELLAFMVDVKNYSAFLASGEGYSSAPVKIHENDPVWTKDPKMALFRDVSSFKWPGWPGPPSPQSSEAHSKYILVDMYAKAMQGMDPKKAVEWAESELNRIYGK